MEYSTDVIYRGSDQDYGSGEKIINISSSWKQCVEPEYFHLLLCKLRIHLDQIGL